MLFLLKLIFEIGLRQATSLGQKEINKPIKQKKHTKKNHTRAKNKIFSKGSSHDMQAG